MTALTAIIALSVAVAMLVLALVLLSIVLVRLSRDAREYRAESLMAWQSVKDWRAHSRRLQKELDAVDRHYAGVPAWTGARHQVDNEPTAALGRPSQPTITMPSYREGT